LVQRLQSIIIIIIIIIVIISIIITRSITMMLNERSAKSWVSNYDAFRRAPKELTEGTCIGALMTCCTAVTCLVLFVCEVNAFLTTEPYTTVRVDTNIDPHIRINFDVHMLDIACEHVTVGVWDAFGTDRMNVTQHIQKQRIDHHGDHKGHPYTEDELMILEFGENNFTSDELAELDVDFDLDGTLEDFQALVKAHDVTLVYYTVPGTTCPKCVRLAPIWNKLAQEINEGNRTYNDADGIKADIRLLKINCMEYRDTCRKESVRDFPAVRLYRRTVAKQNFVQYHGKANAESISNFLEAEVTKRHMHEVTAFHDIFAEGCRLSGFLDVARVPGTLHFQAVHSQNKTLNLAFTNVSHHVHHFSFGKAPRRSISALPTEYKRHVNPLDDKVFISPNFHLAPHHYIKVVHTRFQDLDFQSYQQTHQWSVQTLQRDTAPQAKISYDISPVEVLVSTSARRWYDLVTSVLSIIGGTFSIASMAHGVVQLYTAQMNKLIEWLG